MARTMNAPGAPLKQNSNKANRRFVNKAKPCDLSSAFQAAVVAPGAPVKNRKERTTNSGTEHFEYLAQGGVNASPMKGKRLVIHLYPQTPSGTGTEAKRVNRPPVVGKREEKQTIFIGKRTNLNYEFENC